MPRALCRLMNGSAGVISVDTNSLQLREALEDKQLPSLALKFRTKFY